MTKKQKGKPFVSICTPTFNRRPFIPFMVRCFEQFTYPKDKIEWIIVDDGTDPIGDLVSHIPQVKYFYNPEKMFLGRKRNYMHTKCKGDIIIYMDDDDYYPPERISHAVETLLQNPKTLIAGSSEMHIYFESRNATYQCGPYKQNHATAATFAFRKELLYITKYSDDATMAEERDFLDGYNIPLVQLDTLKTILVFSHKHNSLNKEKLLERPEETKTVLSRYSVNDFIKDEQLRNFYMHDMNILLNTYEQGKPEYKPEVLKEIAAREEKREKMKEQHAKMIEDSKKIYDLLTNTANSNASACANANTTDIILNYEKQLEQKTILIDELLKKVRKLTNELTQSKADHINDINELTAETSTLRSDIALLQCQLEETTNKLLQDGKEQCNLDFDIV